LASDEDEENASDAAAGNSAHAGTPAMFPNEDPLSFSSSSSSSSSLVAVAPFFDGGGLARNTASTLSDNNGNAPPCQNE
jgi:hypothetical protein